MVSLIFFERFMLVLILFFEVIYMDGSCRPGVGIFKLFNNIFTVFPKARLVVELLYSKLRSNGFSCQPVLFKNQVSDLID